MLTTRNWDVWPRLTPLDCGNSLTVGAAAAPATDCSMTCTGNATEACGGPSRLNLFWSGTTGPQTNPGIGGWQFSGCYALVESEECIGKEFGADAWN
jgi:hypothetical protein